MAKAMEIAKVIAAKSPVAVQGTKTLMDYSRDHGIREGLPVSHETDFRTEIHATMELCIFTNDGLLFWEDY